MTVIRFPRGELISSGSSVRVNRMVDMARAQLWRSVSDSQSRRKNLYACRELMLRSSRLSIVPKTLRM
jgi:hypothetical protein